MPWSLVVTEKSKSLSFLILTCAFFKDLPSRTTFPSNFVTKLSLKNPTLKLL